LNVTNLDCRQDGAKIDPRLGRAGYLFNTTIEALEQADAILIVGSNPRIEAPLVNARIHKRWRMGGVTIGHIGVKSDLGYGHDYLGAGPQTLGEVAEGRHMFAGVLKHAKRPAVIVGMGALARADGAAVVSLAARVAVAAAQGADPGWQVFNVLHTAASRVAGLDIGFVPPPSSRDVAGIVAAAGQGQLDLLYLLGADEIDTIALGKAFVIYQGTHGDAGAHRADVILPGAAYTEKSATYVNTEGRAQMTQRASFPPGDAKEDWAIIRALSAKVGAKLPFDSLWELRAALYKLMPHLARLDAVVPLPSAAGAIEAIAAKGGGFGSEPFGSTVVDFHLTNPIARASAIMAELSALKKAATGPQGLRAAE
jgi:NADH-quinone oxidoreductase subunit G